MIMSESFNYVHGVQEGRFDLGTLNSLTKYPSIETYHALGQKGVLKEFVETDFEEGQRDDLPPLARFVGGVEVTEKVDGTNARLIIFPDGLVIVGSREELLYATGDLIHNPTLGIVATLDFLGVIAAARAQLSAPDRIRVVFGEVYGDGIGAAGKRYSAGRKGLTSFRVFDVASVPVEGLVWSKEEAAAWRQRGGQRYENAAVIQATADHLGAGRVPSLITLDAQELPRTVESTRSWLAFHAARTRVALAHREGELVAAEGLVLRGFDVDQRRLLAKIRFEDYDRTLREWAQAASRVPRRQLMTKPLKRSYPKES